MNLIVAVDQEYGIGKDDQLLTHLSEDLKFFKKMTKNQLVIMGRKTLETLPGGKPLPNRKTIILTRNTHFEAPDVTVCHTIEDVLKLVHEIETPESGEPSHEIFVCGGAEIYCALMPYCHFAYITKIQETFHADTHIPNFDARKDWKCVEKSEPIETDGHTIVFTKYENLAVKDKV